MTAYLSRYMQLISPPAGSVLPPELIEKITTLALVKKRFLLISENDEFFRVQLFLCAIDSGLCPVLVPQHWDKQRKELLRQDFSDAYFWDSGKLINLPIKQAKMEIPDCPSYGVFTSGSTGSPKLVLLSVERALINARAHLISFQLTSEFNILKVIPVEHAFSLTAYVWTPLVCGCTVTFINDFSGWSSLRDFKKAQSIIHLTPTIARFLLKSKTEFKAAPNLISIGSARMHKHEMNELIELTGSEVFVTYGLTEAGPRVTTGKWTPSCEEGFIGYPLEGIALKVLSDDQQIKDCGTGQLLIQTPSLKINVSGEEMKSGLLLTPDRVTIKEDGAVFLANRFPESFKYRGYLISLNDLLLQFPSEIDELYALSWLDQYQEHWCLIIEGTPTNELSSRLMNLFSSLTRPDNIFFFPVSMKNSLHKKDFDSLLKLSELQKNQITGQYKASRNKITPRQP